MTSISPDRIRQIEARRDELSALMATGDLPSDRFVQVSKEYAELEPVARAAGEVRRLRAELDVLAGMEDDGDPEIKTMAREEIDTIRERLPVAERALALSLLPRDAADERAAMLDTLRAILHTHLDKGEIAFPAAAWIWRARATGETI